jgi:multiple sugar transport system permease protein
VRKAPDRRVLAATERAAAWAMLAPALAVTFAFALLPVAESAFLSLYRILPALPELGEPFVGLEHYAALAADPATRRAFATTLAFVLLSTASELALGLGLALVLHERFPGRGLVRAAALLPWAIPTVVAAQMWRFIFDDQQGFANLLLFGERAGAYVPWLASPGPAFLALVVADAWKTSSFAGLLILAGLQLIPEDLYDAARLDGAGRWRRFVHVTLPLLRPALLLALLFRTMDAFRVFDLVFVMTQGGPGGATEVLQFHGYRTLFAEGRVGEGAAISVVVFLAIFLLSLVYLRVLGSALLQRNPA